MQSDGKTELTKRKPLTCVPLELVRKGKCVKASGRVRQHTVKLLQPLGLDVAKFNSTWAALDPKAMGGVRITQADKLADAYGLDGVPMLGIGGLYTTSPSKASGGEPLNALQGGQRALMVTEYLVNNFGKA